MTQTRTAGLPGFPGLHGLPSLALLLALAIASSGCNSTDATAAANAIAVVDELQRALRRGDVAAARALVTVECQPAIDEQACKNAAASAPLVIGKAIPERGCTFVQVRNPAAGDAASAFVVVREHGRVVVDLLATASLHAQPTANSAPAPSTLDDLQPRELTPRDHDRIRAYELATPPQ